MSTVAKSRTAAFPDLLAWLEDYGFALPGEPPTAASLRIEDFVDDHAYVVRAEIPGIDPARDAIVQIDGRLLTISGEKREKKRDKGHQELRYGFFSRSVTLPHGAQIERVIAKYVDGVLEVRVPLDDQRHEGRPVQVPVQQRATSHAPAQASGK